MAPNEANKESIICDKVAKPFAGYPHAKRAGNILFVSGLSARQPDNSVVGVEELPSGAIVRSIAKQTEATIENMKAVLESAGASLDNLIDVTVFLTSMSDFAEYNKVYNQYFTAEKGPARTTFGVQSLPGKNLLIEMKGTALL